ncbi:MAG: 6-carboxytetrahydropterin synthase [Elusimicrobia bacterium]|nr:6-carboxytetrahydropterin synthase [Elusimicrobiota bacterium]
MFTVKKIFHICYGHRLLNYKGRCSNLHGHNAKVEIILKSGLLNSRKMVVDFEKIKKIIGSWLDSNLDHKTVLAENDPLAKVLKKNKQALFLTPGNPTAEVLAELIFDFAKDRKLPVKKVKFWETENSCASYQKSEVRSQKSEE